MIIDVFFEHPDLIDVNLTLSNLYYIYIDKCLTFEAGKKHSKLNKDQKRKIIEEISLFKYKSNISINFASGKFTRDQIVETLNALHKKSIDLTDIKFNDILDDICTHTFLIKNDGQNYYFIHKSFQEYFIAEHIFNSMKSNFAAANENLKEFIPVEIATFLKEMLSLSKNFSEFEKKQVMNNLMSIYKNNPGNEQKNIVARGQSSHYLAYLDLMESNKFLEEQYKKENNKWVQRAIMVALARFANRRDILAEYIEMLNRDEEAASIHVGYLLEYYGDQQYEMEFSDNNEEKCDNTIKAIISHLKNEKYSNGWLLDIISLQFLISNPKRGKKILSEENIKILNNFFDKDHEKLGDRFLHEENKLKMMLNEVDKK